MSVQNNVHLNELQSLRGLAALIVLLHHCSFYYVYNPDIKEFTEILLNAHAAVVLFFVLSGYVLCLSLCKKNFSREALLEFYIRRAFRIYPALYIALALALVYALIFTGESLSPIVSPWWHIGRREAPSLYDIFPMLAGVQTHLAVPLWTLKIELAASIVLPFMASLAAYRPSSVWFSALGYITIVALGLGAQIPLVPLYFSGFIFGAMIVYNMRQLSQYVNFIAICGFSTLWFGRLIFDSRFEENYHNPQAVLVEGLGAMLLIWSITSQPGNFAMLRHKILVWLGDISYSLYLVHLSILGLITGFGTERLKLPFMTGSGGFATIFATVSTLVITLGVSTFLYRNVELPMVAIGKRVADKISRIQMV